MQLVRDCGLNIFFDPETLRIAFVDTDEDKFQRPEYSVRTYEALSVILESPASVAGMEQEIIYWMYRNLGLKGNEDMVRVHSLRYDLSVFRLQQFGQELMKTSGHYHPEIYAGGPTYPEIYEVVHGTAVFLMQEVDDIDAGPDSVGVKHCIALECRAGEKAIMPPNFGHVTINPDPDTPLITTNWVCSDFNSVYGGAELCQGFAWYNTVDRGWIENTKYSCDVPRLRHARCADVEELGLITGVGMYKPGCERPELLALCKRPQDYTDLLWKGIQFSDSEDEAWKADYIADFKKRYGSEVAQP